MSRYLRQIKIGSLELDNNLALAPMAGTTEQVYRGICRQFGAGLTVTELVSARGICFDTDFQRTWRYIAIDPEEHPVAIQLFGSEPDDFRKALELIFQHPVLSGCDLIDLNMGCPVAKVVRNGDGCALMRDPRRAGRIIRACVDIASQAGKPVTVKFRKGWDEQQANAVEFALMCQDAGASALTIHGRTRQQMYGGKADWAVIAAVKLAVGLPVYGNGDVDSGESAARMIQETAVDGIMIGRAAQGNPWLFQEITAYLLGLDCNAHNKALPQYTRPDADARVAMMVRHLDGLIRLHGEKTGLREMRSQAAAYLKGTRHGGIYRARAVQAENRQQFLALLEDWRFYCQ